MLTSKISRDVLWNIGAFAIQGACGLLLNVIIGRHYGPAALGLFNQVFALYILLSQVAVFGVQFSALRHVAERYGDKLVVQEVAASAVQLTALTATATCVVAYLATPLLSRSFSDAGFASAWPCVLPGLWCFALNKTLLGIINATSDMSTFAAIQAGRAVLLLASLSLFAWMDVSGQHLAAILSCTEPLLSIVLLLKVRRITGCSLLARTNGWMQRHLAFGGKSFIGGAIIACHARVDIIILGFFTDTTQIGVYSMAMIVFEGVGQVFAVLRNVVNPMITQYFYFGKHAEFQVFRNRIVKITYLITLPCGLAFIGLYSLALPFITGNLAFSDSAPIFAILMVGLIASSGFQPFLLALIQTGHPGPQTLCMAFFLVGNVVGNLIAVPLLGIQGAAVATACSTLFGVVFLRWLFRRTTGHAL